MANSHLSPRDSSGASRPAGCQCVTDCQPPFVVVNGCPCPVCHTPEMLMASGLAGDAELTPLWEHYLNTVFAADLTLWNAQDLSMPAIPARLELKGINPNYLATHLQCAIKVGPRDFWCHTSGDRIQAAQSLVLEAIFRQKWQVFEATGLSSMIRAAFVLTTVLHQLKLSTARMIGHKPDPEEVRLVETLMASPLAQQWQNQEAVEKYIQSPLWHAPQPSGVSKGMEGRG